MEQILEKASPNERFPLVIHYTTEARYKIHAGQLLQAQVLIDKAWDIISSIPNNEAPNYAMVYAFLTEESGHLYYLLKDYEKAQSYYDKGISTTQNNGTSWQSNGRIARINMGLGCIHELLPRPKAENRYFNDAYFAYKKMQYLLKTKKLKQQLKKYEIMFLGKNPITEEIIVAMDCRNPLEFIIPFPAVK